MAYERELEWNEPPSLCERRYARWAVVRAAGAPARSWWPLARIGAVHLYLAPPGSERDAPVASFTPLIAAKRGRRGSGDYAGVDGAVQTDGFDDCTAAGAPPPERPFAPPGQAAQCANDDGAIRVAVVDVSFDRHLGALPAPVDGPMLVGVPGLAQDVVAVASRGPGHGTQMAGVVLSQFPGAHVGLFQIPGAAGAARPYLAAADLAAAVAAAVESWQADVVLIAMSDGAWGIPRYLRDVLREAARCGRGGRGTPIFCSVGDPSRNHSRQEDSAALGADDLASQPWVHAIAACDREGRWYRVYAGYDSPGASPANGNSGATYNRLGPAVALAALGEPTRWSEHIASDDSSQATALAAAAAARTLDENRALTAAELRALLAVTADVPGTVDGGRGLAAGVFDGRDRLGHSLKIGHGVVNTRAACAGAGDPIGLALIATEIVAPQAERGPPHPGPLPHGGEGTRNAVRAIAVARVWSGVVGRAARRGDPVAGEYLRVAGRLSRLFLTSLQAREAFCWLARHARALSESEHPAVWRAQHHGALLERIRHALETARDALGPDEAETSARLQALETVFADTDAEATVGTFLATAFRPAVMTAADGGQGQPRATAFAGDALGDRHRRRGPRHADGGGELERAPLARPDVPRPLH